MKIRSKTISYDAMKNNVVTKKKKKTIENSVQCLESKISLTEDEKGKLENSRESIVAFREKKIMGVVLRSRARWFVD